jgi:hypothetical protein
MAERGMRKASKALLMDIDQVLAPYGARKLSTKELEAYLEAKYIFGWEVDAQLIHDNNPVLIRLLFDQLPNQSLPIIVLHSPHLTPLSFPHLESNGKLCVWPSRYIVDLNNANYISSLLADAVALIDEGLRGQINDHFEVEFLNYWYYHCRPGSSDISLLDPDNKTSRPISVYRAFSDVYVFGDSTARVIEWLDNQRKLPSESGKTKLRERAVARIERSAIIFFPRVIHPADYPSSAKDFYDLIVREFGRDSDQILVLVANSLSCKSISHPQLLLSFTTTNGQALVGLRFDRNIFAKVGGKCPLDGFRAQIPLHILKNRTQYMKVWGRLINRLDPSWVIGRDANPTRASIAVHTVAIIGCGSIGSSVARLLVKSGLTKLILIDGESLQTENIGRHELGYDYHKINKALALKNKLCKEFPFLKVQAVDQDFYYCEQFRGILSDADVIFSATGNWYSDQQVLKLQSEEFYPVVFSFVEANALAGHVIVNPPDTGVFNLLHYCSGKNVGILKETATLWPNDTLVKVPACAGEFQPYGAIEIGHIHSVAAKKIIDILKAGNEKILTPTHSIWFGDTRDLADLGGGWNTFWERDGFKIGSGSKLAEFRFINDVWVSKEHHG